MKVIIFLIKGYRKGISPFLPARCRYYPSCSTYALECFEKLSFFAASWYVLRRIIKCWPLFAGGYDPVPAKNRRN